MDQQLCLSFVGRSLSWGLECCLKSLGEKFNIPVFVCGLGMAGGGGMRCVFHRIESLCTSVGGLECSLRLPVNWGLPLSFGVIFLALNPFFYRVSGFVDLSCFFSLEPGQPVLSFSV